MTDIVTRMSEQKNNWDSTVSTSYASPAFNFLYNSVAFSKNFTFKLQTNDIFRAKKPVDLNKLFH